MTLWTKLPTSDRIEAIKDAWRDEYRTAGEIARSLSVKYGEVTRGSVTGFYHRYRTDLLSYPLLGAQGGNKRPMQALGKKHVKPSPEPKETEDKSPEPLNLTLMELGTHHCKWPVTDGGPYLFCGCDKPVDRPYCDYHAEKALGKGTVQERDAHLVRGIA